MCDIIIASIASIAAIIEPIMRYLSYMVVHLSTAASISTTMQTMTVIIAR